MTPISSRLMVTLLVGLSNVACIETSVIRVGASSPSGAPSASAPDSSSPNDATAADGDGAANSGDSSASSGDSSANSGDSSANSGDSSANSGDSSASSDSSADVNQGSAAAPATPSSDPPPYGEFVDLSGSGAPTEESATDDGQSDDGSTPAAVDSASSCGVFSVTTLLALESAQEFLPSRRWSFGANASMLYVHTVLTGLDSGEHEIELTFYTPEGRLHRRKVLKFVVGDVQPTGESWEYVEPVAQPEGLVVSYPLPLAGTTVQTNALYGGWRLTTRFDGDAEPVDSTWFEVFNPAAD